MPLGLTTAQKNYAGPVLWLAIITDPDGVVRKYGEDLVGAGAYLGPEAYYPYLKIENGPTLSRSMSADSADIILLNGDLAVGNLMSAQDWEGCSCVLYVYLLGLQSSIEIFRGVLTDGEQSDQGVKFRVVSELDAAQIDAQERIYSTNCTLRFGKPQCGYDAATSVVTEVLAERTADVFTTVTIGDSTLGMTENAHKNRYVVITAGTGKGQKRRILSNSSTVLTVINRFATTPDGTSKFKVFTFSTGAPKFLFTAASSVPEADQDINTPRTIGNSGLSMPVNAHAGDTVVMLTYDYVEIERRKVGSNTATTLTIDASEADMNLGAHQFRVLFRECPKDHSQSCEMRARAHRFNGSPTLTPSLVQTLRSPDAALIVDDNNNYIPSDY